MVALAVRKSTKVEKHVLILNRYFVKATRSVVCHVRNGGGKEYIVTLNENGTSGCMQCKDEHGTSVNRPCEASVYGRKCYHIKDCLQKESERAARQEAEKIAAMREQEITEAQAQFPYGGVVQVPAYAGSTGVVVSDVYMHPIDQLLCVMVDVDGMAQCFSIYELQDAEKRAAVLQEAADRAAYCSMFGIYDC